MCRLLTKIDIKERFKESGIPLTYFQAGQFLDYHNELLKWNSKAHLISKQDERRIVERHFLESSLLSSFDIFDGQRSVLDLGSGGGFPGVPLKIVKPDLKMTLLESKRWKGLFLKRLIEILNLDEVDVLCERAEVAGAQNEYRHQYDIIVSRAVTELHQLWRLSWPFAKTPGALVALKGSNLPRELVCLQEKYPDLCLETKPLPGVQRGATKKLQVVFVWRAN